MPHDAPRVIACYVGFSYNRNGVGDYAIAASEYLWQPVMVRPAPTHCWLVAVFADASLSAIEAIPSAGTHAFDPALKIGQRARYYHIPVDEDEATAIWAEACAHIGRRYDGLGIALVLISLANHHPSPWYRKRARAFCATIVNWSIFAGTRKRINLLPNTYFDLDTVSAVEGEVWARRWPRAVLVALPAPRMVLQTVAPGHSPV